MDEVNLDELARQIELQGYDAATADRFAVLIGDRPEKDAQGNVLVKDEGGKLLGTLKPLEMFAE